MDRWTGGPVDRWTGGADRAQEAAAGGALEAATVGNVAYGGLALAGPRDPAPVWRLRDPRPGAPARSPNVNLAPAARVSQGGSPVCVVRARRVRP
ncbi:hypothetical protein SHKM778_01680 [Streptomyces sp. KM77-8]|uniref:Uncharacterized protein n=1 Tax=Streptomyces haneummycinicus TaxID=3074435 RepID=A0AAT9H8R2_9ACTN